MAWPYDEIGLTTDFGLPTLLGPSGEFKQVDPAYAASLGIPIGPPRPAEERPTGGPEEPGNEPPPYYNPGAKQMWASAEGGVPPGYTREGLPEGLTWDQDYGEDEDFEEGLGTTFGYQDPGESPVGAWGDFLDSPEAYGVALPRAELRRIFGDEDKAHNAIVEVQNPETGKTIRAPIIDKGPAGWVIDRQGPTIDLTEGAYRQLGMRSRLEPLKWKVVGHEGGKMPVADAVSLPEGFSWDDNTNIAKTTSADTTGLPEGFHWDSPPPRDYGENLNPDLTSKLALLEQTAGPLKINSGYRDAEHNRKVGGAPGSEHVHGNAVDIDTSGMSQAEQLALIEQASASGITGIGVYGNSLHFDVGNRRAWGPSYGHESVPKWAASTIATHLAGTAQPQEQGGGDTLPPGFQWEDTLPASEGTTPSPSAVPAEAPPSRQEQAAYNRTRLKTAIEKTEASGFPVPHTIGKPDEPEGDRAPTRDMENLVEALKQAEKAKVSQGDKAGAEAIVGERTYWENQIKTTGMSEEQEMKSLGITSRKATRATPEEIAKAKQPEPVEPQIGLGTEMKARAAGLKKEEELPQVSTQVADELGLEAWRDLHSGMEIRRPIKEKPPDAAKRAKEQGKTFEEQITPDVLPEWRALAPGAGQEDYKPEWTQPVTKQGEEGKALQDNLSLFLRGGSSEGVLAALEGGYALSANLLPEGTLRNNAIKQRDEVAGMREQIRKGLLPVDREAEMSIIGQLFQGAGQLVSSLPAYAIAPIGGAVSILQLYDEARQDYIQTMKEQGKPVDEAAANRAALEYLIIAGPADVAMDRFIVGKFLKRTAKAGDKTIGQVAADLGKMAGAGGFSEATQETWLNKVANWLEGYDPNRPWTRGVWEAFLVGFGLSGGAGAVAITTEKPAPELGQEMKARFPIPPAEQERLDALKKKMEETAAQKKAAPVEPTPTPPVTPVTPTAEPTPTAPGFTMQPTSDEELARMQAEYEGKPITTEEDTALDRAYDEVQRKKGQPLGEVSVAGRPGPTAAPAGQKPGFQEEYDRLAGVPREDFKKEFLPSFRAAETLAKKLGIGQVEFMDDDRESSAKVTFDDNGKIVLVLNPRKMVAGQNSAAGPKGTYAHAVLGEEAVHGGRMLGLREDWTAKGGLSNSKFVDYVKAEDQKVFNDIKATVKAANPREQRRLLQAIRDSYETYFGPVSKEMDLTDPDALDTIFDEISGRVGTHMRAPENKTMAFVEEFLRQGIQLQKQGMITEVEATTLFKKIANWVKDAINRLAKALPGIREGHFGKEAQTHIRKIEDMLKQLGVEPPVLYAGKLPEPAKPFTETEADRKAAEISERLKTAVRRGAKYREVEQLTGELVEARKAQAALPVREGPATVNIGMETDDGRGITEQQVIDALEEAGVDVKDYRIETSPTGEKTVVAHLEQTLDEQEAFAVARALNQEAIAEKWMGGADLYGPKAEAWKPFNEAYFLSARGTPVTLSQSLEYLETLAKDYAKWKDWYDNFDAFLNRILGDNIEYKPLITDFMAAMSQMGGIGRNVKQMIDKLEEFMETGSITSKGIDFPAKPKFGNLQQAMAGLPLRGPKVGPFSDAMRGIRGAAAIDRHVAMVLFGTRSPSKKQIAKGREVAEQIAQRLGWDTRQVQAAWWAAGKELYGERGKVVETYEQYLEQWRERLNDILTKDREGTQRGLQAARRIHERTGEAAGVPGAGGIAAVGAAQAPQGPEIRIARRGEPNYIVVEDEATRKEDAKRRASLTRARRSYSQGRLGQGSGAGAGTGIHYPEPAPGERLSPDPRVLDSHGASWPTGFDALGIPNPPVADPSKYPPLDSTGRTLGLTTAKVSKQMAADLGLTEGATISRAALHDAIVEKAMSEGDPSLPLTATFVAGGMGSGKSTQMSRHGISKNGKVYIDADTFREWIPEYQQLIDANHPLPGSITQQEVAKLTKRIFWEAVERKLPLIWDAQHSIPEMMEVPAARRFGYAVDGLIVQIDPMEAMIRASIRAKDSGRHIPVPVALNFHAELNEAVNQGRYEKVFGKPVPVVDNTAVRPTGLGAREGPPITPAFEKFFGESKVTYPTGTAKPVYHATRGNFDVFGIGDIGYHFGTVTAAEHRAKHMLGFPMVHPPAERNLPRAKGMNIMKGYLRIERPLRLPDLGSWWPDTVIPALRELKLLGKEHLQTVNQIFQAWNRDDYDVGKRMANLIESLGYDGIVYRNTAEGMRPLSPEELQAAVSQIKVERTGAKTLGFRATVARPGVNIHTLGMTEEEVRTEAAREAEIRAFYIDDSFIAFHSNQFKSATGNIGAYDFGNPSMIAAPASPPVTPTAKPRVHRMINIHSIIPKKTKGLSGKGRWHLVGGPPIKLSRFYRSTTRVFENTPGFEWVGKAIRKHIDLRAKYKGKYGSAAVKPLKAIPLLKRKAALEEFQNFITVEQEQGPAAAAALTLTPHARSLVDAAHRVLDELGDINQKNNVHVFDPKIGAFRPIGKVGHTGTKAYFPRMFKQNIMDILHNPASDPVAWEELKAELIAAGKISQGQRRSGDGKLRGRLHADLQGQRVLRFPRHGPVPVPSEHGLRLLLRHVHALHRELVREDVPDRGVRTEAWQAGQGPVRPCAGAGR